MVLRLFTGMRFNCIHTFKFLPRELLTARDSKEMFMLAVALTYY